MPWAGPDCDPTAVELSLAITERRRFLNLSRNLNHDLEKQLEIGITIRRSSLVLNPTAVDCDPPDEPTQWQKRVVASAFRPRAENRRTPSRAIRAIRDIRGRLRLLVSRNEYLQYRHRCAEDLVRELVEFRQQRLTTDDADFTDKKMLSQLSDSHYGSAKERKLIRCHRFSQECV